MKRLDAVKVVCAMVTGLCMCTAWGQDAGAPPAPDGDGGGQGGRNRERGDMRSMMKGGGRGAGALTMVIEEILNDSEKIEKLGLTDEQVNTLKAGMSTAKQDVDQIRKQEEEISLAQAREMAADTIDEEKVMKLIDSTGEIQTKIAKIRAKQLILIKKTLTVAQIDKAKEMIRDIIKQRAEEWRRKEKDLRDRKGDGKKKKSGDHGDRDDEKSGETKGEVKVE